jgi:tetratricopeptide (TPR) repeat protein
VYHRALALDSSSYRAYLDLAEIQALRGRLVEARATFGRMAAAFPDNAEVAWWRGAFASMTGDYAAAVAHMEQFRERSGHSLYSRKWAGAVLASIAAIHGHMRDAERHLRDAMAAALEENDYGSYHGYVAQLATYDIRVLRRPGRALQEIERALTMFPLDSLPPLARPYLSLARLFVLAGRPARARELLAAYERTVAPDLRRMVETVNTRNAVRGELALREGRAEHAIEEFRLGLAAVRQCPLCGVEPLARAYATAGQTDSAIAVYERYLGTNWLQRVMDDGSRLAPMHRELGRLYEQRGDRTRARKAYMRFLDLWKDCDPELRPAVAEVRRRIRELEVSES